MAAAIPTKIYDIAAHASTPRSAIDYLRQINLLNPNPLCSHCGSEMRIQKEAANKCAGHTLRCPNQECRKHSSIVSGTFYANSHIPLPKQIYLTYYWASNIQISTAEHNLDICSSSLVDWYNFHRDMCSWKLNQLAITLGGPGVVVQVDESVMVKAKHHVGRNLGARQK